MIERIGNAYARFFARPSFALLNKALFYLGARGLGLKNFRNDTISGERKTLETFVARTGRPVVFDVGANTGDWTRKVLAHNPEADMHLFEPQAALAQRLAAEFVRARVNACATGEVAGKLDLFDYSGQSGSEHATLLPDVIESIHAGSSARSEVPVIRLADYCRDNAISRIDFLKIDVEGFEYKTLVGCDALLSAGAVGCIQFEFNEMNVMSHVHLTDFFNLLGPRYELYRILRSGLLPLNRRQTWLNEQFTFQNILAIPAKH